MTGIIFKLFGFAIIIIVILYMAASAFRKARRLDQRIRAFKKEQEELESRKGPRNPYAALSELYEESESKKDRFTKDRR